MKQAPFAQAEPHDQAEQQLSPSSIALSRRTVVGRAANGQPRTYRLVPPAAPEAGYRRLAIAILGLDVKTLAFDLYSGRRSIGGTPVRQLAGSARAA
jgi:hypothetical protein